MKVKRLIEVLKDCNEDWDVYFQAETSDTEADGIIKPVESVYECSITAPGNTKPDDYRVILRADDEEEEE